METDIILSLAPTILIIYLLMFLYFVYLKNSKKQSIQDKKKYTLEFILKDDIDYSKIVFLSKKEKVYNEYTIQLLSILDKIAIGVLNNVFDEDIIYDHYSKYFFYTMRNYKHLLNVERSKLDDPFLFNGYEKILNKWKDRSFEWSDWR